MLEQVNKYTRALEMSFTFLAGKKVSKDHPKLEALGTLDELSSFLGLTASLGRSGKIKKEIEFLQVKIFEIGKDLAEKKKNFKKSEIRLLERKVEEFEKNLPQLEKFILPGGERQACFFHVCRALARRVERRLVALSKREKINPNLLVYLNRLSTFLFVLSRFVNFKKGKKEKVWP